ncbi:MAG: hypothetical protein HDS71_06280 [Bacteroidales bacterium]|nr:hypothetical protein [Bacteroidales bacterium]MBD5223639.1 hypothetical protein [Bacteroidales bacterium]
MALIEEQYIFGIKVNGSSQQITKISISDDQSVYDYICNIALESQWNGNGRFRVAIVNSERIEGLPIGNWVLISGRIGYDWGGSSATFKMQDENGVITERITADTGKGSASGFSVESLARSIFTKASEIVEHFPSASIVNAYQEYQKSIPSARILFMYREATEPKNILDRFERDTIKELSNYLVKFRILENLLKENEDTRSKRLLAEVTDECVNVVKLFY